LNIFEVAHHPNRDADRTGGFIVNAGAEVIVSQALRVVGLGEAGRQFQPGNLPRHMDQ
jgi:hypothetical protein